MNENTQEFDSVKSDLLEVGRLNDHVIFHFSPVYPPLAEKTRTTGIVKVDVTLDERGDVSTVQTASGPKLLRESARSAARKWKFRPFDKDGQPVEVKGFISFKFIL